MTTIRIAVASTPLTTMLDGAVPAALAAILEAGRLGAAIVCLPETGLPGHRVQVDRSHRSRRWNSTRRCRPRRTELATLRSAQSSGTERWTADGREIVSVVIAADGSVVGVQAKTQIDPTEEADYTPDRGRHVFEIAGLRSCDLAVGSGSATWSPTTPSPPPSESSAAR